MLAPATLAALPSTRAIPDHDVFYVARLPSAPFASRESSRVEHLTSGIVHSVHSGNGELDLNDCSKRIEDYVKAVLSEVGSFVPFLADNAR